ncbi:hypothetical protein PUN28_008095 [Cardiocondyla obscurior]|uniref:Uncharacterized protein n=1 Tax=Cardiocondyla obscurior TaxID=286306 RepID=A0AAW2G118_9HYME
MEGRLGAVEEYFNRRGFSPRVVFLSLSLSLSFLLLLFFLSPFFYLEICRRRPYTSGANIFYAKVDGSGTIICTLIIRGYSEIKRTTVRSFLSN